MSIMWFILFAGILLIHNAEEWIFVDRLTFSSPGRRIRLPVTRFRVVSRPEEPDFERLAFTPILPASEARESLGLVPFAPDAPYLVGSQRWAFRVRIDRRRPEAAAVRERLQQLVASELETSGRDFVGSKRRRELKELAEAELLAGATPRTKVIECCLDGKTLFVASTAKAYLGVVLELVRRIGIVGKGASPLPCELSSAGKGSGNVRVSIRSANQ